MKRYAILTNRKRTIIALVHTVVFLAVAAFGVLTVVRPLHAASPVSAWTLVAVYTIVSTVLLVLAGVSGNGVERLYFACCATSAVFGLLRQVFGDQQMFVAVYIRVVMLACAVVTGLSILKEHWPVAE